MGCVDPFVMLNILGIPQDYAEVETNLIRSYLAIVVKEREREREGKFDARQTSVCSE